MAGAVPPAAYRWRSYRPGAALARLAQIAR
jgi:hypothetical protein